MKTTSLTLILVGAIFARTLFAQTAEETGTSFAEWFSEDKWKVVC